MAIAQNAGAANILNPARAAIIANAAIPTAITGRFGNLYSYTLLKK
jgi:hypothetical protein